MRFLMLPLALLIVVLQYQLWFGEGGLHDLSTLDSSIATQRAENEALTERNQRLAAEVSGLREPGDAVEELAREQLGLVAEGEVFFQVVVESPVTDAGP